MAGIQIGMDLKTLVLVDGARPDEESPAAAAPSVEPSRPRTDDGDSGAESGFAREDAAASRRGAADGEAGAGALGRQAATDAAGQGDAVQAAKLAAPAPAGLDLAVESEANGALLDSYTSGQGGLGVESDFNITVDFEGTWTDDLQAQFILAAEYLSSLILGDVADWGGIDDIVISATLSDIDGAGGVLGQAGPTGIRSAGALPYSGMMEFDTADAADYHRMGLFDDIVIHEMLHTLGFGTVWSNLGLTTGLVFFDNMVFTGANAMAALAALFPEVAAASPNGVPVETDGGSGTAGSHWDNDTFGNELMTGFIDDVNYVSGLTVAALEDMGYDTVFDASNPTAEVLQPDDLLGGGGTVDPEPWLGNDIYIVDSADDVVTEKDGTGIDTVQAYVSYELGAHVENLVLFGSAKRGSGNGLDNRITGNGSGNALGGEGGDDMIWGEGGKDELDGDGGDDTLYGGQKADVLFGGKGRDILQGDGGSDDFVFTSVKESGTSGKTRDRILDFGGKDEIVLTKIDAVKGQSGNQAFVLDEGGAFEAGEIRVREMKSGLLVELNVDGDAQAEMSILLDGYKGNLTENDFAL